MPESTSSETLEKVFWGGGEYVVSTRRPEGGVDLYGPFYNDVVARTWAQDTMNDEALRRTSILCVKPPTKPARKDNA